MRGRESTDWNQDVYQEGMGRRRGGVRQEEEKSERKCWEICGINLEREPENMFELQKGKTEEVGGRRQTESESGRLRVCLLIALSY